MNVYSTIDKLNDKSAALEYSQGHPQRKILMLRYLASKANTFEPIIEDFVIWPPPLITTVAPRLVGLVIGNEAQAVTVSANDYVAKVSRSLPFETFVRRDNVRVTAWVDVALLGDRSPVYVDQMKTLAQGTETRIIHVDDASCCHWSILLRRMRDK